MNEKIEKEENSSLVGTGAASLNNTPKNETGQQQQIEIPSFKDIWKTRDIGESELLADFIDIELIIEGYEQLDGNYGPYVIITVKIEGEGKQLRSSSKTIADQLGRIEDRLPVKARIVKKMGKNGRSYFSFD